MKFKVTITWDRPERDESVKFRAVYETPNQCFKQLRRILWSTVLKAVEKSRSKSVVERPASSETKM